MSGSSCKLISINIEKDKHHDRVLPFLQHEQPDVVCMQEIFSGDAERYQYELGMSSVFGPMTVHPSRYVDGAFHVQGVAIFSRYPVSNMHVSLYAGFKNHLPTYIPRDAKTYNHVLLTCDVQKDDVTYTIGTTHFTWTSHGEADDLQRKNITSLLRVLKKFPDIVFCGDFNAPRGREIFEKLAKKYKDNIPAEVTSTIDPILHRAPNLEYVVDGIFSTRKYGVEHVRAEIGVSDHKALIADIHAA